MVLIDESMVGLRASESRKCLALRKIEIVTTLIICHRHQKQQNDLLFDITVLSPGNSPTRALDYQ